jgi:hypothetical protein
MRKQGDLAEHMQGFYKSRRGISRSNRPSSRETHRNEKIQDGEGDRTRNPRPDRPENP